MKEYRFVGDEGVTVDPEFIGLRWEIGFYEGETYMEGGQFSVKVNLNYRSMSNKDNRKGVFEEIYE